MPEVAQDNQTEKTTKRSRSAASQAQDGVFWTVGRRKEAVARIRMSLGKGAIVVNDKPLEEAYTDSLMKSTVLQPLAITERQDAFDISVKVAGGGKQAQSSAIALGIARALQQYDATLRPLLKKEGLLTRDARMKERKKYGLKRARKAPQFSKR